MEKPSDDIVPAQELVQEIVKAKKQLKLYPRNNPIYIKTVDETYGKFNNFFQLNNELLLKINQNEILFSNEQIYSNPGKDDNLALFFFKDGIRSLTFEKGFTRQEFEDFIMILNTDFENVALDDDVVTLLWEHEFEHIKYDVDEDFLTDDEYETNKMYEKVKENLYSDDDLSRAYRDGLKTGEQFASKVSPLSENDLKYIAKEIAKDELQPKIDKTILILFELLRQTGEKVTISEIAGFIEDTVSYCISGGEFKKAAFIINSIKSIIKNGKIKEEKIRALKRILHTMNSESYIQEIGKIIDSVAVIDENELIAYIRNLDKVSIPFFIKLMGELQSIQGKRLIIEILSTIGRLDIETIARGLSDTNWSVVKNTLTILGKIADARSIDYLTRTLSHPDKTVRKETIKTMGNIGSRNIIPHLKKILDDKDEDVRIAAVRALGNTKSDAAKKILLKELTKKTFLSREFDEKKQFFEAIANWRDKDVRDFLLSTLKKKKFWRRAKNDETRACAAYAIGISGDKDAVSSLGKALHSKNKLLNKLTADAIKRLSA
jgi:HEAT repeat protein